MAFPVDYWNAYERRVDSLAEYVKLVDQLTVSWPRRRFVWRGVATADYALHSSLYRTVRATGGSTEKDLEKKEGEILDEARRWWLQRTATDQLSALELLAALQHQWVPTRLLDFSHNALVSLWFATEEKRDEQGERRPDSDGRIFIAQSNGREITPRWERDPDLPWQPKAPKGWGRDIWIWTPPPIDPRMSRQQGCFVFAGAPATPGGWNRSPQGEGLLKQAEIRECVSVPIRLNSPKYIESPKQRGKAPGYPLAFTLRIPADAKPAIRRQLDRGFGFTPAMMYPDFAGFAKFAASLRSN
jgi:hypothetical protein